MRRMLPGLFLVLGLALALGLAALPAGPQAEAQTLSPSAGERGGASGIAAALAELQRAANREIGRHLKSIRDGQGAGPLLLGLCLAFLYGAVHAAGPGHGKLVVVGYFLSREARIGRGLAMGAQIAVMHVVSAVIVVGLADLLLRRTFGGAPAEIPAVRIASYTLIVAIGLFMLVRAARRVFLGPPVRAHAHGPDEQAAHTHPHHAAEDHGCRAHGHAGEGGLLALAVGLVPCTGSLLVLLYSLANDMLGTGLLLVGCIALGMAITMGGLGLASVWARRFVLERVHAARPALFLSGLFELAGAGLVTSVSALLLAGSL